MTRARRSLLLSLLLAAMACRASEIVEKDSVTETANQAQRAPGIESAAAVYEVLAETPAARLVRARWLPGQRDVFHSHPTGLWFALTDLELVIEFAESATLKRRIPAGSSGVQPPVASHRIANAGSAEGQVVFLETFSGESDAHVFSPRAPDATAVGNHFQLLEQHELNRLILAELPPGLRDRLHSHRPAIVFALTDVLLAVYTPGAGQSVFTLAAGEGAISPAVMSHYVENLGTETARFLIFESP